MAKILLADDDPDIRGLAMMILHGWGHTVIEAGTGFDAVTQAFKESPDLILLDYHMPEQDGFVALAQLRRQGAQMPIVMLTGESSQAFAIQCFRSGADDFLSKPFDPDYLPIVVDRALRHAKTRDKVSAMSSEVFALLSALRGLYGVLGRTEKCQGCGRGEGHDEGCPVQHAGRVLDRLGGAPAVFGARPGGGGLNLNQEGLSRSTISWNSVVTFSTSLVQEKAQGSPSLRYWQASKGAMSSSALPVASTSFANAPPIKRSRPIRRRRMQTGCIGDLPLESVGKTAAGSKRQAMSDKSDSQIYLRWHIRADGELYGQYF